MINGAIISGYAYTVMAKASHLIGMNDAGGVRRVVRRGIVVALVTI
jgi:Na+-driven multidrug efflux pump